MSLYLEKLDYRPTPIGMVSLRRRRELKLGMDVFEIDLSTLAPLRALRARALDRAWARRAVGEGVMFCPRAGCGKSASPVRSSAMNV
jgi:hypothetical protein